MTSSAARGNRDGLEQLVEDGCISHLPERGLWVWRSRSELARIPGSRWARIPAIVEAAGR